jgi:hypothetical protein
MKPVTEIFESTNLELALACQKCESSCCKKGLLFMLPEDVNKIQQWLTRNDIHLLQSFLAI